MSPSRKLLLIGGLLLVIWGMTYGLYYALFDEHQTLETITASLARGFSLAAARDMDSARAALDAYAAAKFEYVREVDVHSHWSGLALLLILFGLLFDQVNFSERARQGLAIAMVAGSWLFPAAVLLQTVNQGVVPKVLAVVGSALVILSLAAVAAGFARVKGGTA
jgi:hypothetical protein